MRVLRGLAVAIGALLLLGAVAAAGYGLGLADAGRQPVQAAPVATARPDPCAVEAAVYANAGSSSDSDVFIRARQDYRDCRRLHPR
ncbi:MAG: hypothetical protein ACRDGE_10260 [Candidatus Limnocylindria bacterium]